MSDALSDHQIDFWNRARAFARDEPQRSVRIRGNHYTIWPENDTGARGFGGRPFTIRFLSDGHTVRTTTLWWVFVKVGCRAPCCPSMRKHQHS